MTNHFCAPVLFDINKTFYMDRKQACGHGEHSGEVTPILVFPENVLL